MKSKLSGCCASDDECVQSRAKPRAFSMSDAEEGSGPAVEAPPCPICTRAAGRTVHAISDNQRRVFACTNCNFTFIWPRIEQDFSELPERAYYDDWEQLNFDGIDFIVADVTAAVGRRVAQGLRGSYEPPAVLDAGC